MYIEFFTGLFVFWLIYLRYIKKEKTYNCRHCKIILPENNVLYLGKIKVCRNCYKLLEPKFDYKLYYLFNDDNLYYENCLLFNNCTPEDDLF